MPATLMMTLDMATKQQFTPKALLQLLSKYDRLVPRYTSYPTAPHFSQQINAETYQHWLRQLPSSPLSIYCHIPFCAQLCWYCGCHTKITQHQKIITDYITSLAAEIRLVHSHFNTALPLAQLHFGGGSPSLLQPAQFELIYNEIAHCFDVDAKTAIAIELDPRTLTKEKINTYVSAGVNRVSLGVQDFDLEVQHAIHRVQPFEMVKQTVDMLREQHLHQINFDLIYGLPAQTVNGFQKTIEQVIQLNPSRIALFGYAHVPWKKKHMQMISKHPLPDDLTRLTLFYHASEMLLEAGYIAVGLDHFVKPGDPLHISLQQRKLSRNFQGYESNAAVETLLGIGVSSISTLPQGYAQNCLDIITYHHAISNHQLPIAKGISLNTRDKMHSAIIQQLMCYLEVDLHRYSNDISLFSNSLQALALFAKDGLIHIHHGHIKINTSAKQVVRLVCAAFDDYYRPAETCRHASIA